MAFVTELKSIKVFDDQDPKKRALDNAKDKMFTELTDIHLVKVRNSILNAAKKGAQKKYINFNREDFKANFPGMGTPAQVQKEWLKEMCNPQSKYIITDDEGKKLTLEGISADVWNNAKFTTVFSW